MKSLTITNLLLNSFIIFIFSCENSSQQDVIKVQTVLNENANLHLKKSEIQIISYNSNTVADDRDETYSIKIPDETHAKILSIINKNTLWKNIEKGYQLSYYTKTPENTGYLAYIFYVDKKKPEIDIQIIKE